jgi:hypothetical protein
VVTQDQGTLRAVAFTTPLGDQGNGWRYDRQTKQVLESGTRCIKFLLEGAEGVWKSFLEVSVLTMLAAYDK